MHLRSHGGGDGDPAPTQIGREIRPKLASSWGAGR